MGIENNAKMPRPASSWEAVAAALFSERQEMSHDSYESSGSESDGARSMTPESENSDAENNVPACSEQRRRGDGGAERAPPAAAMTTTSMLPATARGNTSSVLSYAAAHSQVRHDHFDLTSRSRGPGRALSERKTLSRQKMTPCFFFGQRNEKSALFFETKRQKKPSR